MQLYQLDDQGRLFIGPAVDDWRPVLSTGIQVFVDLDEEPDVGVEVLPTTTLYLCFFFDDTDSLPDLARLHQLAQQLADAVRAERKVLVHCAMGHNRSALLAGVVLYYLGFPASGIVPRIRERRDGALYNRVYRAYLESLAEVKTG